MSSTEQGDEVIRRLGNIEYRVASIEETTAFSFRANREEHLTIIRGIFGKSRVRALAYLAADGTRSVQEIADLVGQKRPNVNAELRLLHEEQLLSAQVDGNQTFYHKKPFDRALGVSRDLRARFSITEI